MSGLLTLNSEKVEADTSPVAPASIQSSVPDPSANPYEMLGTLSDVGELGFLFGHDPVEFAPSAIQSSPEPTIEAGTMEAMKAADEGTFTTHPQNAPGHQILVEQKDPSGWSFSDTMRNEVASFQQRVRNLRSNGGGQ